MRGYQLVASNQIKSTFSYRAHVIFQILASGAGIAIQFFLWRAVYSSVEGGVEQGIIRGMDFNQTFLYVSLATTIGILMRTWVEWEVNGQIRSGDIIMFFFKPVDYQAYMFASSMGFMAGNLITITLPGFFVVFIVLSAKVALGWNLLFFAITLVGSCLLSFLFDFFIGTTCFWTQSIWGISAAKDVLILFLSGALMPLQFYPEGFMNVVRWLPFPYIYNLPLMILTGSGTFSYDWIKGLSIQVFWILAIFAIVRSYYRFSLRKLVVNGG
ncbi:MAG TPA: hypothetical protein VJ861_08705 [Treponemataceae bacterium]|nr:hypothetical protein [Treponemataceae bacterium]